MKRIIRFFNRKYPLHYTSNISIIVISTGIGLFLLLLKPFGFVNYKGDKILASFGFTIITLVCLIILNYIKKNLVKKLIKRWTIFREILFLCFVILIISIGNFLYIPFIIKGFGMSFLSLLYSILLTLSIGIIPISFMTILRYKRIINNELGLLISSGDETNKITDEFIKFSSLNKTEKEVVVPKKDLLFIEAIKNNIHIYYYEDNYVKTISVRNTLINTKKQLSDEIIFRCHRSFIVNTINIKTAKGNLNGYKIYFNDYNHFVPVSRSYARAFQEMIY